MTPTRAVVRMLRVEPGEGRPVGLMATLNFLLCFGAVGIQTAGFALFLERFGPAQIAGAYIVSAIGSAVVAMVYLVAAERMPFPRLTRAVLIALVVGTVAVWTGTAAGSDSARYLLPMWFQIVINMSMLVFWAIADGLFDVRQAKRLFGVLSAGRSLGFVAGGLAAPLLLHLVDTADLLLVSAVALTFAVAILGKVWQLHTAPSVLGPPTSPRPGPGRQGRSFPALVRHRYYRSIIAFVTIWWVGYYLVDKIFLGQVVAHSSGPNAISGFLGVFYAVAGALQFVVGAAVTGRVAHRRGLTVSLLATPALLAVGAAVFAIASGSPRSGAALLILAVAMKGVDHAVGFGLDMAMHGIAYRAVPLAVVGKVATLAEGFGQPIALATTAIGLIGLEQGLGLGITALAITLLVVVAVWLTLAVQLGRAYPIALAASLTRRQFSGDRVAFDDHSGRGALLGALGDPAAEVALYAARTLGEIDPGELSTALPTLMTHPSAEVRRWAFAAIGVRADTSMPNSWRPSDEPDADARRYGVRAAVAGLDDPAVALAWFDDIDPAVRRGAIEGLLRFPAMDAPDGRDQGRSLRALAAATVVRMTGSESEPERIEATTIIDGAAARDLMPTLAGLFGDESAAVSRAAIRAAERLEPSDDPDWYRSLVAATARPSCAAAAGATLSRMGYPSLAAIDEALAAPAPVGQLVALATCLGRIGGQEAIRRIDPLLDHRDGLVRASACTALVAATGLASGPAATTDPSYRELLIERLSREAADIEHAARCIGALGAPDAAALVGALRSALFRSVSNLVAIAVVVSVDTGRAVVAHRLLQATRLTRLPEVVDLLEPALPAPVRKAVIPIIERLARPWPTERLDATMLDRLITGATGATPSSATDPWVRATASHLAGVRRIVDCREALAIACTDEDPVVRESAERAHAIIDHQEEPAMFSTVDKVLALKRVSLFAETPDDVLAAVAGLVRQEVVDGRSVIVVEGDPGEEMYVIAAGRVEVRRGGHVLNELGDGDVFGEMAVLDPGLRSATVTALEPTHLLVLDQASLHDLLTERPEIALGIIRVLVRHLRERVADLEAARGPRR